MGDTWRTKLKQESPKASVNSRVEYAEASQLRDKSDREIIRDFMRQDADTLLTSDDDILRHKAELGRLGIRVIRPHEWINEFLKDIRGDEDGVAWIERILFTIGS